MNGGGVGPGLAAGSVGVVANSRLTRIVGITRWSLTVAAGGNVTLELSICLEDSWRHAFVALLTRGGCDGNRSRESGAGACRNAYVL